MTLLAQLRSFLFVLLAAASCCLAETPVAKFDDAKLAAISQQMQAAVDNKEIAGAVTMLVTPDKVIHLEAAGYSDVEKKTPLKTDDLFWIASMTKPITATAIMMLQDAGKLSVDDPASKYLPELAGMKMADGTPAKTITIKHLMTHTAGLPENTPEETKAAKNLQDLMATFTKRPMQFEPGHEWKYSQTAINSMGRIIEVVSGESLPDYFDKHLFQPLGMKDATFYPTEAQLARLSKSYKSEKGELTPVTIFLLAGRSATERDRAPLANGGLFCTANDYGLFLQMVMNGGSINGKQYLKPETVKQMTSNQTDDIKAGFSNGTGWGLGWCVVKKPVGVNALLSPGTCGHEGAYGTQGWIDPEKHVAFVLMVQRSNFGNGDESNVRKAFQDAAIGAIVK